MSIEVIDCTQGTEDWFRARAGVPTASEFSTVLARGKDGGDSVTRRKYLYQLAGEILTGDPAPAGYSNEFMARGQELEDDARQLFAFMTDSEPVRVGFIRNGRKGCSPDSLLGDDSGLEIKVAIPAVQIDRLRRGTLPPEYKAQVQGSMWVAERPSWSFISYCPKLPPLILTVERDEAYIAQLAKAVDAFNEELDAIVASISGVDQFRKAVAA